MEKKGESGMSGKRRNKKYKYEENSNVERRGKNITEGREGGGRITGRGKLKGRRKREREGNAISMFDSITSNPHLEYNSE